MNIVKPYYKIESPDPLDIYAYQGILRNIEIAGRTAYKSEERITQDSAEKFVQMLVKRGHESVLEHEFLRIRFICDRGVTHEIVRHRLVAYTQESTRYCNYGKLGVTFIDPCFWATDSHLYHVWHDAVALAAARYEYMIAEGANPQEARSVLPNSLKTEIVCTANIREWRHILRLRTSAAAHPQMREIMIPLLKELRAALPALFYDIEAGK